MSRALRTRPLALAEGWRAQAEAAQRGAPTNPFFLFERVITGGDVDITRMLGIGMTELLAWPWRSDIDGLRLQLAREVLAHSAEVRAAWVRAVAAQQLVVYHRQVQDAAAAGAELARRMQTVGNFSRLQCASWARGACAARVSRPAWCCRCSTPASHCGRLRRPGRWRPGTAWNRCASRPALRERYVLYRSAHDLARYQLDELVPLKRSITDVMLLRYNGMLVGVFDLLADARAQVGAVIAAIEAQRDFWLADAALKAAIVGAPSSAASLATAAAAPSAELKGH